MIDINRRDRERRLALAVSTATLLTASLPENAADTRLNDDTRGYARETRTLGMTLRTEVPGPAALGSHTMASLQLFFGTGNPKIFVLCTGSNE